MIKFKKFITTILSLVRTSLKDVLATTPAKPISKIDIKLEKFIKTTKLHILVPIIGIIICILKMYLPYIVAFSVILYWIIRYFNQTEPPVDHDTIYINIRDTIYQPMIKMNGYLPIRQPNTIVDIVHIPNYVNNRNHALYLYKLQKTTQERASQEAIDFAIKILQTNIDQELNQYEYTYNDLSTFYNDLRSITVTDIIDQGTYFQIQIVLIDNDSAYKYAIHKLTNQEQFNNSTDTKDEDF